MPKHLTRLMLSYRSPDLLLRFPILIGLQFLIGWAMTLRFWQSKKFIKRILRQKGTKQSILDIGCGSGEITYSIIKSYPEHRFVGMDPNENSLLTADRYNRYRGITNFELAKGRIEELKAKEAYDLIVGVSAFQYVKDLEDGLLKMKQALKPQGHLMIYIPVNYKRILPGYSYARTHWFRKIDYNVKYPDCGWTDQDLMAAAEKVGLKIQENHYVYGTAGKIAYELLSFGQLMIFRLPWILAFLFALVYFPIITLPAWLLMAVDLAKNHQSGNGFVLILSRD